MNLLGHPKYTQVTIFNPVAKGQHLPAGHVLSWGQLANTA